MSYLYKNRILDSTKSSFGLYMRSVAKHLFRDYLYVIIRRINKLKKVERKV